MARLIAALDQSVTRIGISGVRYTRQQLYYEFCRTLLPFARVVASWSSVAAVGSASVLAAWRPSRPLWGVSQFGGIGFRGDAGKIRE